MFPAWPPPGPGPATVGPSESNPGPSLAITTAQCPPPLPWVAISRIHPFFLLLRALALLPTQASARGGHDLSGLFLPSLPFGEMSGLGARFDEAVVPFESLGAFPFAWKRCDSNELVIFGDSRSGSTFHFCVL